MLALLFLFVSTIQLCNAHRYLFVSLNVGYSHLEFDGRLADILVERGHEVVSFSAFLIFIYFKGGKRSWRFWEKLGISGNITFIIHNKRS
jgi:hypothetical protein